MNGEITEYLQAWKDGDDGALERLLPLVYAELRSIVYGDSVGSLLPPVSFKSDKSSTESPIKGKPYVRLISADFNGVTTVVPGELFDLTATGFAAGARYEVLIDGVALKGEVTADGNGSFRTRIAAPAAYGFHRVEVRLSGDDRSIDGSCSS